MIKYEIDKSYSDPDVTEEELIECYKDGRLYDLIACSDCVDMYDSEEEARAAFQGSESTIHQNEDGYYEIVLREINYGEVTIERNEFDGEIIKYEALKTLNNLVTAPFDAETIILQKGLGLEGYYEI